MQKKQIVPDGQKSACYTTASDKTIKDNKGVSECVV